MGFSIDDVILLSPSTSNQKAPIPDSLLCNPQKAQSLHTVRPATLPSLVQRSHNWIVTGKIDGVRALHYLGDYGSFYLGGNKTKGTGTYNNLTPNVEHLVYLYDELGFTGNTVLDGELLFPHGYLDTGSVEVTNTLSATSALVNCNPEKSQRLQARYGYLEYHIFDCLYFNGVDLRDHPLRIRLKFVDQLVRIFQSVSPLFKAEKRFVPSRYGDDKEPFYRDCITWTEGVMYKDLDAPYTRRYKHYTKHWIKRKVRNTVDGFVTGFIPGKAGFKGLVGALVVSVYDADGNEVEVCRVSNLELSLRNSISNSSGDLVGSFYGTVVEVSYQELTGRSARGRHAVIERFRPDKTPADCLLENAKRT
jgi:ATP-dependent DNA ligase